MNLSPKKVCITGGAGFIGSKLAATWKARGAEVVVVDDLSVGKAENVPQGVELVICDILDTDSVVEAMRSVELVYHLAARVAIRSSFECVVADTMANVSGTASVLRAAQLAGSVRKFVLTSSMAVYSDSKVGERIDESWPTMPISPYGISKLAAEALTSQLCAHAGIDSAILRLFNTYGPGQALSPYVGAVTIFCNRLAGGEQPTIYGDGEQCRDFVHVDDIVQALLLAGTVSTSGQVFNIGTGHATTINEVVSHLEEALNIHIPAKYVEAAPGELRSSVPDISKARSILGYEPRRVFATSVAEVARQIAKVGSAPLWRAS
ncbi:SDR family oxidoreductase [soil metagenome]